MLGIASAERAFHEVGSDTVHKKKAQQIDSFYLEVVFFLVVSNQIIV